MDELGAIRDAITAWHARLESDPIFAAAGVSETDEPQDGLERNALLGQRFDRASEHLASCLEDQELPDSLVDDLLSVADAFAALCGLGPLAVPAAPAGPLRGADPDRPPGAPGPGLVLHPAKLKLLGVHAALGLPVHTTSIGRRASASYCVYESMGGWETLSAAVESIYNRMRNDQRCASMFHEANEQQLKTNMLEFLTCSLGGKARFASSTLLQSQRDQLRSHGFGVGQFDVLLTHMKAVLDELGVQPDLAGSAVALLRCQKHLFEWRVSEAAHPDYEQAEAEGGDS